MAPRLGYLLPTRERIMSGEPETTPLLELASRAERLGWDSIWMSGQRRGRTAHQSRWQPRFPPGLSEWTKSG